ASAAVHIYEQQRARAQLVTALLFAADTAWQLRLPEETRRWVERGLPVAREAGDRESEARLLSLAATLASLAGEYDRATALLDEAAHLDTGRLEAEGVAVIRTGGRLVVAQANPVRAIEPVATAIIEESEIGATIFEPLLGTDVNGHLIPWLCERWEAADEGRSFILTLRRDVCFSDGAPLTAAAVKRSIENASRSAPALPAAFAAISGIAAYRAGETDTVSGILSRGELDLQIHLAEALPIFPALLTEGSTAIARPLDVQSGRPGLVGTGPFRLVAQTAERVVLERNPSYWRPGLPRLDAIEFQPALSPQTIARRFRAGELDLARDLQPQDLDEILRDPGFRQRLVEAPKKNTYFVLFNAASGPVTSEIAVRRALAGVIRPRDLVWRTLGRFAEPAACLIPPGMLGHDAGRRWPSMPPDKALAILREAGIEPGRVITASIQPLLRERAPALITGLLTAWAGLGVEVVSEPLDMQAFLATWRENAAIDLTIGRWNADYDDPDNFTYTLFQSGSGVLHRYFSSPEADRLIEEARAESQPAAREVLYRRFESLLLDAAAVVPLFHDIDYRLASPKVRGLVLRGTKPYVNYADIGVAHASEPATDVRRIGGGVVNIPMTSGIASLDPVQQSTAEVAEVLPAVFQTLTAEQGLARIVACLAAGFRVEDSGLRYRFHLREDVRFHNGRRLTARDVRYSLERLLFGAHAGRESFASIRGAKALLCGDAKDLAGFRIQSAREFTIELEEPIAYFPALLAQSEAAIIPEGGEPASGAAAGAWVGTGPFRVVAFEPGRRLELERNRAYWRPNYPCSDRLVFHFGVAPKDILSGFLEGRYSLASELLPGDVEELRRQPEFASGYKETPRLVTYYVAFNIRRGPMSDPALRRRLAHGVDVPRLVRQTLGRLAIPAHSVIPPGLLGHDPAALSFFDGGRTTSETVASGIEARAAIHPVVAGPYTSLARELSSIFAAQGVAVTPVTPTMTEFLEAHARPTADLYIGRWNADYPDPDTFASIFQSDTGFLGRVCGSPDTDRLIARARTESIPSVRHTLYRELEEILAREAVILPLFHEQAYRIARPEVEGLSLGLGFPTVALEELRVRT
ncbi:MAG TPA: ABC transporter substrate-binding protein, partial [Vicinamibacterales bacterium]|nr:ABC transporter substrate-binding protein [Vicinamibacterales bacterium]